MFASHTGYLIVASRLPTSKGRAGLFYQALLVFSLSTSLPPDLIAAEHRIDMHTHQNMLKYSLCSSHSSFPHPHTRHTADDDDTDHDDYVPRASSPPQASKHKRQPRRSSSNPSLMRQASNAPGKAITRRPPSEIEASRMAVAGLR